MNDLVINKATALDNITKVERVQKILSQLPQCETMKAENHFSGNMYIRKLWREAGTIIVGKVHKEPHFFMCMKGEIHVWDGEKVTVLKAGDVLESKPGTKRITIAVEDSIGATCHFVGAERDLDKIEAKLLEEDPTALFDSNNQIKDLLLQSQKIQKLKGVTL